MNLYYLGPKGSYSYEAANKIKDFFTKNLQELNIKSCSNFFQIFKELENPDTLAILPVENSTEGSVNTVIDYLYSAENINISGELIINISHCFYVSNQTEKPHKIYSHSQALAQCSEFLKNHSDSNLIPVESTSQAIENIIKEKNCGAIASKVCGEIHNIKPIKENINDNPLNQTRFFLISSNINKSFAFLEDFPKKVSIAFYFSKDKAGSLYKVLQIFATEEINLSKIESRPAKKELGEYLFFLDFSLDIPEEKFKNVLEELEKITKYLKILGIYAKIKL